MTTAERIAEIRKRCKCEVTIAFNGHTTGHESIEEYLSHGEPIDPNRLAEMTARDSLVEVVAYPDTPVGAYWVAHWDLDSALDEMLGILRADL